MELVNVRKTQRYLKFPAFHCSEAVSKQTGACAARVQSKILFYNLPIILQDMTHLSVYTHEELRSFIDRQASMPVTVFDSSAFRDLLPTKLLTFLTSLMWGGPVGGCFVLTPLKSRLAAATRMVRAATLLSFMSLLSR